MRSLLLRATAVWCGLLVVAIANGVVREVWLSPAFREVAGSVVSSVVLCVAIVLVTWLTVDWMRPTRPRAAILIGSLWLALTLAFELLGGRYLLGARWTALFADFDLAAGRLFVFVLLSTWLAPIWASYRRGLLGFSAEDTPPAAKPGEVNFDMFDRFSFAHLAVGVVYALLGLGPVVVLVLAVGWEVVENSLKACLPAVFPSSTRDTLRNALGDVLSVSAGWAIASYLLTR